MANFVALIDPDADRRTRYVRALRDALAFTDGLVTATLEAGDFAVVWAAAPSAPVSVWRGDAAAALVIGDAIPGPGPDRGDARGLFDAWRPGRPAPVHDGFHVALRYDAADGLVAGADVLGLFPVHWAHVPPVTIVAASPRAVRAHPLVPHDVAIDGLAGLLLANAPVEGRTLTAAIRRLAPGHRLVRDGDGRTTECPHYRIPAGAEAGTFDGHVDELAMTFEQVLARHVPAGDVGVLLSGGRDSRTIAGTLDRLGARPVALTLGRRDDYEAGAARAVARTLGWRHRTAGIRAADYAGFARTQARWEQPGSFSTVHTWGAVDAVRALPGRVVTGYGLFWGIWDATLPSPRPGEDAMEAFDATRSTLQRGLSAAALRGLLRPALRDVADERAAALRALHDGAAERASERTWRFLLAHDRRAHAGSVPWRLSLGAWPVLPVLDRQLLELLARLPRATLAHRRAQDALLCRYFPALARLPLDRNSHDDSPLRPGRGRRLAQPFLTGARRLRTRLAPTRERRYYHRMYDLNGAGWRAVREIAEPQRDLLHAWFDADALARFLPPPPAPIALANPVRDGFPHRSLLGLMLWAADPG